MRTQNLVAMTEPRVNGSLSKENFKWFEGRVKKITKQCCFSVGASMIGENGNDERSDQGMEFEFFSPFLA